MKAEFKWGKCGVHETSHTGGKKKRSIVDIFAYWCVLRGSVKHEKLKTGSIFDVKNLDHSTAGGIHLLRLIPLLKTSEVCHRTRSRLISVINIDAAWNEP